MKYQKPSIPNVVLMTPEIFGDERGFLWKPSACPSLKSAVVITH